MAFGRYIEDIGKYARRFGFGALAALQAFTPAVTAGEGAKPVKRDFRYAVVVSHETYESAGWKAVADGLAKKHKGKIVVFTDTEGVEGAALKLRKLGGVTHVTYFAKKNEIGFDDLPGDFDGEVDALKSNNAFRFYKMLAGLDEDPYPD